MNFRKSATALLCFLASSMYGFAQLLPNEYTLGKERHLHVTQGVLYDNGGKNSELKNEYFITTLHGENQLEVYFETFNIPDGASLKVYRGKDTDGELLGIFHDAKIPNLKGKILTFEFSPSKHLAKGNYKIRGQVKSTPQEKSGAARSQPASDCVGAIPLCQNLTAVALGGLYTDLGAVNDDDGSCYGGTGSGGSVWYSFQPQANGPLDFTITPTGSTDYDFVLWDITSGCGNGQRQQVSCNYSQYTGNTGISSVNCSESYGTCTGNDCSSDSKGSDCNRFNRRPTVNSTHKYAVCINFYSGSNDGFTIQFKNETSSVNITDVTPPVILNASANACPTAAQFELLFSEYVDCSTIQSADFSIPGHTVSLNPLNCTNNSTNSVAVTVTPPLSSGTYALHAQDILDLCGNNMNTNFNIVIGTNPTATASSSGGICRSPGFLGIGYTYTPASQTLTATGGGFYKWSDGQIGASVSVSPKTTTTYTVTVTQGACPATATVTVPVEDAPTINIPDQTICTGESKTLTATGGGSYQWYTNPSLFGNGTAIPAPTGTNASITVSPSSTTTYRVVVTSPAGCKGQDDVKLTIVNTNCCNATIAPAGPYCTSDAPKILTAGTSGGTWSGTGISNASTGEFSPAVSGAGSFKVYYTLACGSLDSATIVVQVCTPLVVCKQPNGNLTASGGISPYTWESQSTIQDCSSCPGGNCIPFICPGTPTTTWTGFGSTATVTPPGTYPIRVRDSGGNVISIASLASVNPCSTCPSITVSVQNKQDANCQSANSGSATFTATGGSGSYTYTWSPNVSSTATANSLAAGTYNVTATDANNCTGTGTVTIGVPTTPTLTLSNQTNPACGQANGSVSITLAGGTAPYIATIDNGQGAPVTQNIPIAGTAPVNNLAAGTYIITIRDANNCTATQTLTLIAPNAPVIGTPTTSNETCSGQNNGALTSATVTGGTGTLQWSYALAATPGNITAIVSFPVNNLAPNNYVLKVQDANGCADTIQFVIAAGPNCCNLTLDIATIQPNCGQNSGSITITPSPSGTYSYTWNNSLPNQATQSSLAAGQYLVTVAEVGNPACSVDTVINLNNSNGPSIAFSNKVEPGCGTANGSVSATLAGGSAPYTITIDDGQGAPQTQVIPIAGTAPVTGMAAGTYIISVTDANNCTATQTIVFTAPNSPVITSINATAETCFGDNNGTANVSVNGGTGTLIYAWSNGASSAAIANLAPNTYSVTITDAANCTASGNITVAAGPVCCTWNISAAIVQPSCGANDGSINITVLPIATYTYTWSNNAITANNSNIAAGNYSVTITNTANSCVKDTSFSLSNPNAPTVSGVNATAESCAGGDGAISITATGGTGTLTVTWSNGATGNSITNLSAGTYNYTITDNNNCMVTGDTIVAPPTGCCNLQLTAIANNTDCSGANGSIQANIATAGIPPYTFSIDGNTYQSSSNFLNLTAGNYVVFAKDSTSCIDTVHVTIGSIANTLSVALNVVQPGCAGVNAGSITANATGGNGTITYVWNTGAMAAAIQNLSAGKYVVTVSDSLGCSVKDSATLLSAQPVTVNIGNDVSFCQGDSSTLAAPAGFATYVWSNGSTVATTTANTGGIYSVTVTDINGCTASDSLQITILPTPIIELPQDTTVYENNAVRLHPVITNGSSPATYLWQPNIDISCNDCAHPIAHPADTITYHLTYIGSNQCRATAQITINVKIGGTIYMPNVFSPNNDGNNDILLPLGIGIKTIQWKVFNRWGEMVFVSSNENIGWDGTYQGVLQPAGTYVYLLQVTFFNKSTHNYKGSFTLVR